MEVVAKDAVSVKMLGSVVVHSVMPALLLYNHFCF